MGQFNSTPAGNRNFGDALREAMQDQVPPMSIEQLLKLLEERGYGTSASRLNRLRRGGEGEPGALLIWRIAELELLRKPNGEAYSHEEILLMLCEHVKPFEQWQPSEVVANDVPNGEAVAFLHELIRKQRKGLTAFAREHEIAQERMEEILQGSEPTPPELVKLAKYLKDRNPAPLIELYYPAAGSDAALGRRKTSRQAQKE